MTDQHYSRGIGAISTDSDQKTLASSEPLVVLVQPYEQAKEANQPASLNSQEILYYSEWLSIQAQREQDQQGEQRKKYVEEVHKPVLFNEQEVHVFAPINLA